MLGWPLLIIGKHCIVKRRRSAAAGWYLERCTLTGWTHCQRLPLLCWSQIVTRHQQLQGAWVHFLGVGHLCHQNAKELCRAKVLAPVLKCLPNLIYPNFPNMQQLLTLISTKMFIHQPVIKFTFIFIGSAFAHVSFAKCPSVPNVHMCQQQQVHKSRRSIKSPFTCFAWACLARPDSKDWMKLWKARHWEEMKLFDGRKWKTESKVSNPKQIRRSNWIMKKTDKSLTIRNRSTRKTYSSNMTRFKIFKPNCGIQYRF